MIATVARGVSRNLASVRNVKRMRQVARINAGQAERKKVLTLCYMKEIFGGGEMR
jgi:hypothetical protein